MNHSGGVRVSKCGLEQIQHLIITVGLEATVWVSTPFKVVSLVDNKWKSTHKWKTHGPTTLWNVTAFCVHSFFFSSTKQKWLANFLMYFVCKFTSEIKQNFSIFVFSTRFFFQCFEFFCACKLKCEKSCVICFCNNTLTSRQWINVRSIIIRLMKTKNSARTSNL